MSVGYLANSFDLINVRDVCLIAQARAICSHLIVGVFSDEYAEEVFGRRPVVPLLERMALVQHMRGVDEVVVHADDQLSMSAAIVTFTVLGDELYQSAEPIVVLDPLRVTASISLGEALRAARQDEVA